MGQSSAHSSNLQGIDMCEPVTIAMLAISAVSAAVSYTQAKSAADNQQKAIQANTEQQMKTLVTQQWQARGNAAEQMSARAKAAAVERGRLTVIGAETGLGGVNSNHIFNEADFNAGQDITSIQRNARNIQEQSSLQQRGITAQAQGQLNTISRPSALGAGLQIAAAGASAYGGYQDKMKLATAIPTQYPAPIVSLN